MLALTRETILQHLQEVSTLVDLYRDRDPAFGERVLVWLSRLEESLGRLRHPLASMPASERGTILAVPDGLRPEGVDPSVSLRKAHRATVSRALRRAEAALREVLETTDRQLQEHREKMAQMLAVATAEQPIPLPPTQPRQLWLETVWSTLETTHGAQGMYAYLNAALQRSDRLYLLDEILRNVTRDATETRAPPG